MKKSKIVTTIVASVISVSTFSTVLAGCKDSEPYVFEYEVSVIGGTGSGTYKDGSDCSVTAEIPEGKKFDKWVNEFGEVLSIANPYTFKVDGDMEVYAIVSNMQTYKVEVIGGTITGTSDYDVTVYAGDEVSVTANSSNSHKFKEWLINGTETSKANPYKFTATKDMKIEAVVDESYLIAVSGGTIGETEDTRKIYEAGEECTVIAGEAPVSGTEFAYWYVLDEDGNEKILTFDTTYTFTVTGTDKYYAKFGVKHTVTVEGGIFEGYPDHSTISILDGTNVTIKLDTENIPQGKGFNGWNIGDKIVSKDLTLRLTEVTEDTVVKADLADKVKYETPDMSANQVMRKRMSGGNENDYCLELDRGATSVFTENTDYVTLYIYETQFAGKNEWVGQMRVVSEDGVWRLVTKDGEKLWDIEGSVGNMWIDTKDNFHQGKGHRGNTMDMFKRAIESCGNEYSESSPYYLAAQIVAKPYSLSADSDISVIGPQSFIQTDVAKHTVTITDGKIKDTELSQVTMYEGQQITIVPTIQDFKYWRINGEIVEGAEQTLTIGDKAISAVAVPDRMYSVTVNGGQITTEGIDADEIEPGIVITLLANEPAEGKRFAGWYKTVGGEEVKISDNAECELEVTSNMTVTAKYINIYTVTVVNGLVNGMDKATDGKYVVDEGTKLTIVPDWTKIPEDKAFAGWQTGSNTVLTNWYHVSVDGDVTVTGLLEDTAQLATPENANNEMFKVLANGILEIDRRNTKVETEFVASVDCIRMYFYNFTFADTADSLGYVDIIKNGDKIYFADKDGAKLFDLKGKASDLYHDNAGEAGYASLSDMLFAIVKAAVGEDNFDASTPYYVAVQARSNDTKYTPSEISAIGAQAFIKNSVAQHTVTIMGGKIKGTNLTEVTLYKGQKITIVPDDTETFGGWLINDGFASAQEYELTVNGDTVITVRDKDAEVTKHTVTVEGGTVGTDGEVELEVEFGTEVTVTATVPENKAFLYWYVLNGDIEEVISENATYTFEVAKDITLIAKFANVYTLTVNGGTVTGDVEDGKVIDGTKVTISLDLGAIPAGKGFTHWTIGDEREETAFEFELTITANTTVTAVYADKVAAFTTPTMSAGKEMLRRNDNYVLDIDRCGPTATDTAFVENVEYVKFYIYTTTFADKSDFVGAFKLDKNSDGTFRFATIEGATLWNLEGTPGNIWLDTKDGYGTDRKGNFFNMMQRVLGDKFDADTPYYFAAQTCGKDGSIYTNSEISEIGPQVFIKNNVAQHIVTITGGVVKGTQLTELTIYAGQKLTIVTNEEDFKFWLVNGEKFTETTIEITVTADTTVRAITQDAFEVSVTGGTFKDSTDTTKEVVPGDRYTIVANIPEDGKAFAYWYTLGEDEEETVVSYDEEFTFTAEAAVTYRAKFVTVYTLTVTGGTVTGDVEDGIVKENTKVTISLDLEAIPAGKGFTHWTIGDEREETAFEFELTITADTTVTAVYADKVSEFDRPVNDSNQFFKVLDNGTIEIDRKNKGVQSEFDNANIEYILFYFYNLPFVAPTAENSVGQIKFNRIINNGNESYRFETLDGRVLWTAKGKKSDLYHDNAAEAGYPDKSEMLFALVKGAVGDENFNPNAPYYVAIQACGKEGSIYAPSEISAIGPQAFIKNNVAQHTVTITGGKIKGTEITSVTVYAGQQITVEPTDTENFGGWLINSTQKIDETEYTFTVNESMNIAACSNETYTVTVAEGCTVNGSSQAQVNGGEKVTLTVTDPEEGKVYGWYKTVEEGDDVFICKGNSVDFYPTENVNLTVKVLEKVTAPVNDSNQMFNFESDTCIILDRFGGPTVFTDNVDYIKFYIYSSREPDAQPIGYMILDRNGSVGSGKCRLATTEGEMLLDLKGALGNLYLDGTSKDAVRNAFKTALGEDVYNNAAHLYVAAQACSNNPEYEASDISAIGTVDFKA